MISVRYWSEITSLEADAVFIYEVSPMTQAMSDIRFSQKLGIPCYIYVTDL